MSKTITFDFDNTIAMSHMDTSGDELEVKFEEYNESVIKLIKKYIKSGHDVHIVTARDPSKEVLFPKDTVRSHLDRLSLSYYFTDERIHYTSDTPKIKTLEKLGSTLHYDDNMQEHIDNFGGIPVKHPYDFYPDTDEVAKAIIYDSEDRILLLRRTDEGRAWDIPGGHLKNIEVNRGPEGYEEGLEREVAEETGLILPFADKIGEYEFSWKGKNNDIVFYRAKFITEKPECNLKIQGFMENSEYKWVSMDEIYKYAKNGTQILRKAVEIVQNKGFLTEEERFQAAMKRKHRKMKLKLIGIGKNKHFGGGKGHSRPNMERSKSAPPGFGALGEQIDKKKRKIKVKIVQNIDEKRRKRRKKRRNRGSNWPYIGGFMHDLTGDGGDGGGGE